MTLFLFLFYLAGISISYLLVGLECVALTFKGEKASKRQCLAVASLWPTVGLAIVLLVIAIGIILGMNSIKNVLEIDFDIDFGM